MTGNVSTKLIRKWSLLKSPQWVRNIVFRQVTNRKKQKHAKSLGNWFLCCHYLLYVKHLILLELYHLALLCALHWTLKENSLSPITTKSTCLSSATSFFLVAYLQKSALFSTMRYTQTDCKHPIHNDEMQLFTSQAFFLKLSHFMCTDASWEYLLYSLRKGECALPFTHSVQFSLCHCMVLHRWTNTQGQFQLLR